MYNLYTYIFLLDCRYFYQLFLSKKKTRKSSEDKRGLFSFFKKKAKKTESVPATQACHLGANHVTIPIPDYDHEVLRRVVSFVHLGHVTVTTDTVIGKYREYKCMCLPFYEEIPI